MKAPTRPIPRPRWETIRWFGQTIATRPGIFIFLWGTTPSYSRIPLSRLSSPIPSFGRLASDEILPCACAVFSSDVPLDSHVWPANIFQGSSFLLHESGARPRPVCRGRAKVLFRHLEKEQLCV